MNLKDRWRQCWKTAGASGSPVGPWKALSAAYSEPHRAYHTLRHIGHCLEEFDEVRGEVKDPSAVEWALWYHDAIYDTHARDNEERSAVLAEKTVSAAGLPRTLGRRVGDLIRISTHRKQSSDPDARLFADIDLAILGRPPEEFAEYESQVRREYDWVAEAEFRAGRAPILETFLDRFSIFMTPHFQEKYEKQARMNLTASLLVLKGGAP